MSDPVPIYILLMIGALMLANYRLSYGRASRLGLRGVGDVDIPQAQPRHYARLSAVVAGLTGLIIYFSGMTLRVEAPGVLFDLLWILILVAATGLASVFTISGTREGFAARAYTERMSESALMGLSLVAVVTTFGIVASLLFEATLFFRDVSILEFLFGTQWSPQTAIRAGQVGQSGAFGAIPVFAGTFLVTLIALAVAGPIGLLVAIYLSEYASRRTRAIVKPAIEVLAGIPTVVYGFFALISVGPAIRNLADMLGANVPTQSALAAGLVMGIMIIPLVSSLSDDVIRAVPQSVRDGSTALGATQSETLKGVVFRSALPGIIGAFLLAISRAIGETMIVVMAAGRAANLSANPFESVTTVTVQIVALLTGDQLFDSPRTLAAFALGLVLFVITLILNIVALSVVNRYRRRFE